MEIGWEGCAKVWMGVGKAGRWNRQQRTARNGCPTLRAFGLDVPFELRG
jgi:hypothetical protein